MYGQALAEVNNQNGGTRYAVPLGIRSTPVGRLFRWTRSVLFKRYDGGPS